MLPRLLPWYAAASAITFGLYAYDKGQARTGGRRVPERTLHTLEALGGWPGALIGQHTLRHKTRKFKYQAVFWLIVVAHIVLIRLIT